MSNGMTHDDARDTLAALALDALDAPERALVLAHVRGCEACQRELEQLERTAAELAQAVAPVPMSPMQRDRIRARLLARAAADRTPDVIPIGMAPSARKARAVNRHPASRWVAIAASLLAVGSVALLARTMGERDRLRESMRVAAAERGTRAVALDSMRAAVADRDRMIANLTGPSVAVMTLASNDPTSPSGRMFWDQAHDAWVFVAHHLARPKAGRTYQLWLVTPTSKISAGTFAPGASGDAVVRATYALPKDSLAAVAVTEEPASGSAQPTTTPFLVAANR